MLSSAPPTSAQPPQRPQIDTATLRGHVSPPLADYIGCPPSRCEDGVGVTLSFDRDINADAIPPASAFVLRTAGTSRSAVASAVSVAGSTVTVTFARINSDDSSNRVSQLFRVGSTIVLDYTSPTEASQQLKGTNGEAVSGFVDQALTTVPLTAAWSGAPSSWTGQPFSVTLTLSEPMSSAYPPSAGWSIDPDQGDTWAQISVEDADDTQSQFTVTVTPRRNADDTLLNEGDITLTGQAQNCATSPAAFVPSISGGSRNRPRPPSRSAARRHRQSSRVGTTVRTTRRSRPRSKICPECTTGSPSPSAPSSARRSRSATGVWSTAPSR